MPTANDDLRAAAKLFQFRAERAERLVSDACGLLDRAVAHRAAGGVVEIDGEGEWPADVAEFLGRVWDASLPIVGSEAERIIAD